MTPRQFADLAAVIARHAEALGADRGTDATALHRVVLRSGRCFQNWREELCNAASPAVYANFFAAELALRVWCTAVAVSRSTSSGRSAADTIFAGMLDLRCLVLQALVADLGLTSTEAAALDRFRRRCERWADVLIGPLARRTGVTDFAVCPDRAIEFADSSGDARDENAAQSLIAAGLSLTFAAADQFRATASSSNDAPACGLAAALLACIPADTFDGTGCLISPRMARLGRVVDESPLKRSAGRADPCPPVSPDTAEPPTAVERKRPPLGISFASLRKRRPS